MLSLELKSRILVVAIESWFHGNVHQFGSVGFMTYQNCFSDHTGRGLEGKPVEFNLEVFAHFGGLHSGNGQVWPPTQFFLLPFCKKSLICLKGKLMTLIWGTTILFHSSQQLPRLSLRRGALGAFWMAF